MAVDELFNTFTHYVIIYNNIVLHFYVRVSLDDSPGNILLDYHKMCDFSDRHKVLGSLNLN